MDAPREAGRKPAFLITHNCIGCKTCFESCPLHCIDASGYPLRIEQERCDRCGVCRRNCPMGAIMER